MGGTLSLMVIHKRPLLCLALVLLCAACDGRAENGGCSLKTTKGLLDCMRQRKVEDFSYSKLFSDDFDVLVFGEAHIAKTHMGELVSRMAELRAAGITHLAMEAFPASQQALLSKYTSGDSRLRDELATLANSTLGGDTKTYGEIIEAAAANGISLAGVDIDYKGDLDVEGPEGKKREAKHQADRETLWTSTVANLLQKQPGSKVLLIAGQWHISPENSNAPVRLQTRLRDAGLRVKVICLEGGNAFYDSAVTEAARALGLESRRFILPVDPEDPSGSGDYHLHLPQDTRNILQRRDKRS